MHTLHLFSSAIIHQRSTKVGGTEKHDATNPKVNDIQILEILARLLNDYDEGLLTFIRNAGLLGKCVISVMNMEKMCSDGPPDKASDVIARKQMKA